jgi:hypothetical protein
MVGRSPVRKKQSRVTGRPLDLDALYGLRNGSLAYPAGRSGTTVLVAGGFPA